MKCRPGHIACKADESWKAAGRSTYTMPCPYGKSILYARRTKHTANGAPPTPRHSPVQAHTCPTRADTSAGKSRHGTGQTVRYQKTETETPPEQQGGGREKRAYPTGDGHNSDTPAANSRTAWPTGGTQSNPPEADVALKCESCCMSWQAPPVCWCSVLDEKGCE